MPTRYVLLTALLLMGCGDSTPSSSVTQPDSASFPPGDAATVVRVLDGDSLVVASNQAEFEVRLLGINAPEGAECHGDTARQTLNQLTDGNVTLVADGDDSDRFGRLLRYVYVDGVDVNLEMVRAGHAIALQVDHSRRAEYAEAVDAAASARLGLWAGDACSSTASSTPVVIADYSYDPPGRDDEDPNGEWVLLSNEGDQPVAMGGWVLRDESTQNRYRFPEGFILDPGGEVRVSSGCGGDTQQQLYWCAQDPVWSNGGDTVILQNQNGTVVAHDSFAGNQ